MKLSKLLFATSIGVILFFIGMEFGFISITYNSTSNTQQVDGVLVFVLSTPISENYKELGVINETTIERVIEATKGKKKFGDIVSSLFKSSTTELSFNNRLKSIVAHAKEIYPNVDGLVFTKDLTSSVAIEFE